MTELVACATTADVGLFALPDHSHQNVCVLPNKFFELVMAGVALCVSDLPEMSRLLRAHDLGCLITEITPESIAAAVNKLDRLTIDRFKRNALKAAQDLNWDIEGRKLVDLGDPAVARQAGGVGFAQSACRSASEAQQAMTVRIPLGSEPL